MDSDVENDTASDVGNLTLNDTSPEAVSMSGTADSSWGMVVARSGPLTGPTAAAKPPLYTCDRP